MVLRFLMMDYLILMIRMVCWIWVFYVVDDSVNLWKDLNNLSCFIFLFRGVLFNSIIWRRCLWWFVCVNFDQPYPVCRSYDKLLFCIVSFSAEFEEFENNKLHPKIPRRAQHVIPWRICVTGSTGCKM